MKLFRGLAAIAGLASVATAYPYERKHIIPLTPYLCPKRTILGGNEQCIIRGWVEAHRICNADPTCGGIAQPEFQIGQSWIKSLGPEPYVLFGTNSTFGYNGEWTVYSKDWNPAFEYYERRGFALEAKYKCDSQTLDPQKAYCKVQGKVKAKAICDADSTCGGFGQAQFDKDWMSANPESYVLFETVGSVTTPNNAWVFWTKADLSGALTKTMPQQTASFELHESETKVKIAVYSQSVTRPTPTWTGWDDARNYLITQCQSKVTLCKGVITPEYTGVRVSFDGSAPDLAMLKAFITDGIEVLKASGTGRTWGTYNQQIQSDTYSGELTVPKAVYGEVWVYSHDEGSNKMTGMSGGTFTMRVIGLRGTSDVVAACPPSITIASTLLGLVPVLGPFLSGSISVACDAITWFA